MALSLKPLNAEVVSQHLSSLPERYSLISKKENRGSYRSIYEEYLAFDKSKALNVRLRVLDVQKLSEERRNYYLGVLELSMAVNHPNLIQLNDYWIQGDFFYIATKETSGSRLDELMNGDRLSPHRALEVGTQVGELLAHLHSDKIYHGSVCPRGIYVDKNYVVNLNPFGLDALMFELYPELFRSEDTYDYVSKDMLKMHGCERQKDIHSLGSLMVYMCTGYTDWMIRKDQWERFGVDEAFVEPVARAIRAVDYRYYTRIDEFLSILEDKQVEKFGSEVNDGCIKSRMHRMRATHQLSSRTSVLNTLRTGRLDGTSESGQTCELFNKRYVLYDCVEYSAAYRQFNAVDEFLKKSKVDVKLLDYDGSGEWSHSFRKLVAKMMGLKHPHVTETFDGGLLSDVGYLSSQREMGERLKEFQARRNVTRQEVAGFCIQMADALAAADKVGLHGYALSLETVYAYRSPKGGYHYRSNCFGEAQIYGLTMRQDEVITSLCKPDTSAPEMFNNKLYGLATTQFIFGNIVFSLLANGHPFENKGIDEVAHYYTHGGSLRIESYRQGLSPQFCEWLARLMQTNPANRFASAQEMVDELHQALGVE